LMQTRPIASLVSTFHGASPVAKNVLHINT
jgi:hypothetical protein